MEFAASHRIDLIAQAILSAFDTFALAKMAVLAGD